MYLKFPGIGILCFLVCHCSLFCNLFFHCLNAKGLRCIALYKRRCIIIIIITPAMHYTLVRGSSYQIWQPQGISKQFDLWLTPADTCTTFDPRNALHFGQGFFLPNLQSQGISKQFDLWLTRADPCMNFDPAMHHALIRGSSYQFGQPQDISKQFDLWLTPADSCMTFDPSNALHFGQGFFLSKLVDIGHF